VCSAKRSVNHAPPPFPGLADGRDGLQQAFAMFWRATPGHHEIEDMIAEGDKVVTRLRASAATRVTCRGSRRRERSW
jgi:hypothetical protein